MVLMTSFAEEEPAGSVKRTTPSGCSSSVLLLEEGNDDDENDGSGGGCDRTTSPLRAAPLRAVRIAAAAGRPKRPAQASRSNPSAVRAHHQPLLQLVQRLLRCRLRCRLIVIRKFAVEIVFLVASCHRRAPVKILHPCRHRHLRRFL